MTTLAIISYQNPEGNYNLNAGVDGALSSLLFEGATVGVSSAVSAVKKGSNATQQEISKGIRDTVSSNKVDVKNVFQNAMQNMKKPVELFKEQFTSTNQNSNNQNANNNSLPNLKDVITENMENDIDNTANLSYNNTERDGGTNGEEARDLEQRRILRNNEAMREQEQGGNTTNIENTERENIGSRNGKGNISEKTIEQEYKDIATIHKTMEYAKQNQVKIPTKELIDVQNKAKELGINLIAYNGENGNTHLGLTDGSDVYLDLNRKNISKEDGSLMDRFSHEVLHYIKRNTSFADTINELQSEIVSKNPEAIDNFISSKEYKIENVPESFRETIAEEILGDYSAKYISGYDVDYGLPENIAYVLNTTIDDGITELKLKNSNKTNSNMQEAKIISYQNPEGNYNFFEID